MTLLALIRHMPTVWNRDGRLQGRRDTPLDRDALPPWRLPPELAGYRVLSSPLGRARDTAALLGAEPLIDDRLTEMSWGKWEGHTLRELRSTFANIDELEAQGLDFRPPGGESPREVQARVAPLLAEIAAEGVPAVAITHKGVMRAILARATGWDMLGKPPCRLDWSAAQLFRVDDEGNPAVERLNIRLAG